MTTSLLVAAAAVVLPVVGIVGTVSALDMEEPAFEMLMRAVGFSPWGAAMVYIAWQARRDVKAALERIAALWDETLDIVAPWADRARDISSAIRESQSGDEPTVARKATAAPARPRRPKTNPVNLP